MDVTVFSKPACVQCNATYRALDKQGTEYAKVDVSQDLASLEYIQELGFQQAPVVILKDSDGVIQDSWSGFDPDKIAQLVA